MTPELSVVVPCFNEAGNLHDLTKKFYLLTENRPDIEVIFVDNGSTDSTPIVLANLLSQYKNSSFKSLRVEANLGYGYGLLKGLEVSQGQTLAWTHADLQTSPNDLLTAFDIYQRNKSQKIVVKGKRMNRRLIDRIFSQAMEAIVLLGLKVSLHEINAQPKMFSKSFYEKHLKNKAPYDFSIDLFLLIVAKKNNYSMIEIPVTFFDRSIGEAKGGGTWKTRLSLIFRTLIFIYKLRSKI
jgi:glycosyltransferase involved in cell wall biosynthesis